MRPAKAAVKSFKWTAVFSAFIAWMLLMIFLADKIGVITWPQRLAIPGIIGIMLLMLAPFFIFLRFATGFFRPSVDITLIREDTVTASVPLNTMRTALKLTMKARIPTAFSTPARRQP